MTSRASLGRRRAILRRAQWVIVLVQCLWFASYMRHPETSDVVAIFVTSLALTLNSVLYDCGVVPQISYASCWCARCEYPRKGLTPEQACPECGLVPASVSLEPVILGPTHLPQSGPAACKSAARGTGAGSTPGDSGDTPATRS